jgi:hypothetical protein
MDEQELLSRFADLHRAVADRDALERRLRVHDGDPQLRALSLAACERVLQRRAALYRCLIRQGWNAPDDVVRHLLEDEALLAEPLGPAGG